MGRFSARRVEKKGDAVSFTLSEFREEVKVAIPCTNVWNDEKKEYVQDVDPMEEYLLEIYIKSCER